LFPLKADLIFDDRQYMLGDTMVVAVEITPSSDVELREGRVELVCHERWTEIHSFKVQDASLPHRTGTSGMNVGRLPVARADIPGMAVKKFAKRYVHTAQTFVTGATLRSGRPHRFEVRLEPARTLLSMDEMRDRRNPSRKLSDYRADLGEHAARWNLRMFADVVQARNVKVQRDVAILVD
jgi:hypothetical protein